MEVVATLNQEALLQVDSLVALQLLEKALDLLQYHANCGKTIDRNLIITVIYNLAGVNQALCNLERAAQYLEGVVFNMQEMVREETNQVFLIKRMHLLTIVQLQYCGILSQLRQHSLGYSVANQTVALLNRLFEISQQYQSSQQLINQSKKYQKGQFVYEDYDFKHLLLKRSEELLNMISKFVGKELVDPSEREQLQQISNQVFCWKMNQRSLTQKLCQRSMIGLLNENEWLSSFDLSNVMHIRLLTYEEVCLKGEILYEFSQKVLVEKTLLLSVAYFSLATESRHLKQENSQLYHLKAISIYCNLVQEHSPFLDHLLCSFVTHYQQHLETIQEEQSFVDQSTKIEEKIEEVTIANKENNTNDHLKLLIESLSKDKVKKQESIKKTINHLQTLKDKLNKNKSDITLKRFKTEPSIHFDKNDKNCRQVLQQLMKQQ